MRHKERKGNSELVLKPSLNGWLPPGGRSLVIKEIRHCD